MASQIEIAQIVNMIAAAYPHFSEKVTQQTVDVYYELLKDLPADLLKAATLQCCAEAGRKFAPSVGELRGAAVELQVKAQGVPSALEAWNETCTAHYRKVDENNLFFRDGQVYTVDPDAHQWSSPLVEKVAKMLGWPDFPDPDNESVDRAHFLKQYDAELSRFTSSVIELPEVTRYIESAAGTQVKQLAERIKI